MPYMGRSPETTKEHTENISPEELLTYLRLPTNDDTQTAFAKKGLHISETTATRWRELANEGDVVLIDAQYDASPEEEIPRGCALPCCNWLCRKFATTRTEGPGWRSMRATPQTRACSTSTEECQ